MLRLMSSPHSRRACPPESRILGTDRFVKLIFEQKATENRHRIYLTRSRDVEMAVLNAQTAFAASPLPTSSGTQTAQVLAPAQTRCKLGFSSIVEVSQAQLRSIKRRSRPLMHVMTHCSHSGLDYAHGDIWRGNGMPL